MLKRLTIEEKREKERIKKANQRAKKRDSKISDNSDNTDVGFTPEKAQEVHDRRKGTETILMYKKNDFEYFFLIKNKSKNNEFSIIRRSKFAGRMIQDYTSESMATEEFDRIKSGILSVNWLGYTRYSDSARKILSITRSGSVEKIPNHEEKYGLLLAMEEIDSNEFGGRSSVTPRGPERVAAFRRKAFDILGDDNLPDPKSKNSIMIFRSKWFWVMEEYLKRSGVISEVSWREFSFLIIRVAEQVASLPEHSLLGNSFRQEAIKHIKRLENNYWYSESTSTGKIRTRQPRETIPVDDLKRIFDIAFRVGSNSIYPYIILSLSTGLRPTEVKSRICIHRAKYLNPDGTLNYKTVPGKGIPPLISKTEEIQKINPFTSIVTRLILKHEDLFNPCIEPKIFFSSTLGLYRNEEGLSEWSERHFRTTCATMLSFCTDASVYRSSLRDVQYRLGHSTLDMAFSHYAKNAPTNTLSPELYLGFSGLKLSIDKKEYDFGVGSNLWDLFLLKDVVERLVPHLRAYNTGLLARFKKALKDELEFQVKLRPENNSTSIKLDKLTID